MGGEGGDFYIHLRKKIKFLWYSLISYLLRTSTYILLKIGTQSTQLVVQDTGDI
jgi:hypothetical protein